jgi:hypothetical protein
MKRCSRRALALALTIMSATVVTARGDSITGDTPFIRISFSGEISASNESFAPPTITPAVGDPFVLNLTFWRTDAPYAKTNAGAPDYTARGAYSEELLINGTPYFGGQDFGSFDTQSFLTLNQDVLSFLATDQGYGASGSATVGGDFPTSWFADIRNPLPNNAQHNDFSALGSLNYFYGLSVPSISGTITGGSVDLTGGVQMALPVPEAGTLGILLPVSLLLLRRRHATPSAT